MVLSVADKDIREFEKFRADLLPWDKPTLQFALQQGVIFAGHIGMSVR
jgi:hypothetical protein